MKLLSRTKPLIQPITMKSCLSFLICIVSIIPTELLNAQNSPNSCKVDLESLSGKYTGDCKNGLAEGKGEAFGTHHYVGVFKNGLPNGKGIYNYNDSTYHSGNFQDGIREGKGEAHYVRKGMPDSVVAGYWSADEYRGKQYKTYNFTSNQNFDSYEVSPSAQSGNSITFEISTTSGSPNGAPTRLDPNGSYILTIASITSINDDLIKKQSSYESVSKSVSTYEISSFPASFFITLSNGKTINLELYKSARWTVKLYLNK
jgi:hypothetical protein